MKTFSVTQDTDLKDFTDAVYPQGSFCFSALLKAKNIKVNGARVRENVSLSRGDEVIYYTTPKQEQIPSHGVVYEDKNLLIADKASGVSSEALLFELCARGELYAVHRLDRNTEGLIIFAKTKEAEGELLRAFKNRLIDKTYIALCKNAFAKKRATLTAYLKKDEKVGLVKIYDEKKSGSETIVTEYCVEEERGDVALVSVRLHTGKTHQIRAHLAHIGCPVLGDEKYGDRQLNAKYGAKRQRLVAKYLTIDSGGCLSYLKGKTFQSAYNLNIE